MCTDVTRKQELDMLVSIQTEKIVSGKDVKSKIGISTDCACFIEEDKRQKDRYF